MKKLLTLFAMLFTFSGAWADTYTITYNVGGGGSFNASGWCSKWTSSDSPTVTITASGNGFNSGNGNLAQQTFTISVESGYIITGFKISTDAGWGSLVTAESGETETFGNKEKTFSVGANATSTYFTVSASNFNKPVIAVYLEDLVNYASSVTTNVKPHFDYADHYFGLTSDALSSYQSTYESYLISCTEEEYTTLLNSVKNLYSNLDNVCLPNDGFYRFKNKDQQKYLYYENESDGMCVGDKGNAISSVVYVHRDGNTFSLNLQGAYVQAPGGSNGSSATIGGSEVFFTPTINGVNAAIGYAAINVGGRCFSPHGSAIWSWGMYTQASHWTIEEAEDVTITLNSANDNTSAVHTYATLCVPFEITDLAGVGGTVEAYAPSQVGDYIYPGDGATTIAAGTPVLLIGEEGASSVTATIGSDYADTPAGTNVLTGTFTGTSIDCTSSTTNYVLRKDEDNDNRIGFYHVNTTVALGANRAYLNTAGSSVKGFAINFDDIVTGVNDVRGKMEDGTREIFNLAGQRMSRVQKGVNIIDGHKVLVK